MDRIIFSGIKQQQNLVSPSQPYFLSQPPPPPPPPPTPVPQGNLQASGSNLNNKLSPSIVLIIIIMLAIIFFISGLLHLLVRLLLRPQTRDPEDLDNVTAFQGQLQQLFHLHDAGVDQSFIDTLPVFNYKAIIGLKDPFDCAVCLCEFEPEDKLRLLPKCSHAFHMECIDTWLLSHSTCPLCRASLLPDFFPPNSCSSPTVLVLESGSESSREMVADRDGGALCTTNSVSRTSSHLGFHCRDESCEIQAKDDQSQLAMAVGPEEKVVTVKLGKFRNMDSGGGGGGGSSSIGSSNNDGDARRCFSMGSFAYVMDEKSSLQVPIRTPTKKQSSKKGSLPLTSGHWPAMSECDCDSRREFNGFEPFKSVGIHGIGSSGRSVSNENGNAIDVSSKRESFSISKIWLRAKKEKPNPLAAGESSRRAFSFRFPGHRNVVSGEELKTKSGNCSRTISEIDIGRWENWGGSELGCDEENQSCGGLNYQAKTPSFARRTLLWLVGRQNKVVHSSFATNV